MIAARAGRMICVFAYLMCLVECVPARSFSPCSNFDIQHVNPIFIWCYSRAAGLQAPMCYINLTNVGLMKPFQRLA